MNYLLYSQLTKVSKLGFMIHECAMAQQRVKVKYNLWFDLDSYSNQDGRKQVGVDIVFNLDQFDDIRIEFEVVNSNNCSIEQAKSTLITKMKNALESDFFGRSNNRPTIRNKSNLSNFNTFYRKETKKNSMSHTDNTILIKTGLMFNFTQFLKAVIDPSFQKFVDFDKFHPRICDLFEEFPQIAYAPELEIFDKIDELIQSLKINAQLDYRIIRLGLNLDLGYSRLKGYTIKIDGNMDDIKSLPFATSCRVYDRTKGKAVAFVPLEISHLHNPFVAFAQMVSKI
jgi:hypothetical protein